MMEKEIMDVEYLKNGRSLTVKPDGRMDMTGSPELNEKTRAKMEDITELILDMEKVPHVSSGGLRVILEWQQIMDERGGQMKLLHVNEYIMNVFDLTGLLNVFTIE